MGAGLIVGIGIFFLIVMFPGIFQAAHGQEEEEQQQQQMMMMTTTTITPPNDIKIIDPDVITDQIFDDLRRSRLEDVRINENGTAVYTFRVMEDLFMTATTNRTIEVYTEHTFTPEYGYIFNSTGVYTADGTKKVVIPTSEPPIGFEGSSNK